MESNVLTKPLYVISDLHLGDKGPRDNFHAKIITPAGEFDREAEFMSFLKLIKDNNGSLAILGDLFEFWQSNVGTVIAKNKELLSVLSEMDITVILGNHDNDIFELIQDENLRPRHPFFSKIFAPNDYIAYDSELKTTTLRICSVRSGEQSQINIGLLHGHEIDVYNMKSTPGIGRMATIFAGKFEDLIGSPHFEDGKLAEAALFDCFNALKLLSKTLIGSLCSWFIRLFVKEKIKKVTPQFLSETSPQISAVLGHEVVSARFNEEDKLKIRNSLEALRTRKRIFETKGSLVLGGDFDILITGHTHDDTLDATYCNSGSWITKKPSFLIAQPNGDIELYRWCAETYNGSKTVLRGMRKATGEIILYEPFDIYEDKWKKKYSNNTDYRAEGVLAGEL